MKRFSILALVHTLLCLASAAGCGGDGDSEPDASSRRATAGSGGAAGAAGSAPGAGNGGTAGTSAGGNGGLSAGGGAGSAGATTGGAAGSSSGAAGSSSGAAGASSGGSAGTDAGAGGGAPVVSLVASGFSSPPNGDGEYPAATTFTLTPVVSGADVCQRSVTINGAPAQTTGWPGNVSLPFTPQVVSLPTAASTYSFSIRCFGSGGATTATLAIVRTSSTPTPVGCAGFSPPLPAGWTRGALTQFSDIPALEIAGAFLNPFPNGGFSGVVLTTEAQYQAIGFRTPADETAWSNAAPAKRFEWGASQQGGEAILSRVYVSLSSCAGDFRIPAAGSVAPANDPTFARGCRNIRASQGFPKLILSHVRYVIAPAGTPSDDTTCRLAPDTNYFVNFIRADADDGAIGAPAQEAACAQEGAAVCGVQMRID